MAMPAEFWCKPDAVARSQLRASSKLARSQLEASSKPARSQLEASSELGRRFSGSFDGNESHRSG
jgi:hypothetical protein